MQCVSGNLFFLLYFTNAPLVVRLALRALRLILPLLEPEALRSLPLPTDYRYILKSASNIEEILHKLAAKLPTNASEFSHIP